PAAIQLPGPFSSSGPASNDSPSAVSLRLYSVNDGSKPKSRAAARDQAKQGFAQYTPSGIERKGPRQMRLIVPSTPPRVANPAAGLQATSRHRRRARGHSNSRRATSGSGAPPAEFVRRPMEIVTERKRSEERRVGKEGR